MANKKQYWLSLDEKNNESEVNSKEFGTDLPVLNSLSETISTQKSGRRDFLKMLGFGVSAAAVAAACEIPIRKSIPYVVKPEEITPGIPNYYASAYRFDHFNLNKNDTSDWDMMLLKLIETESLSFYSSMSQSTRYRRTEIISNYEPSYKYLDVCTASHVTDKINCSKCEKCLRTQITLELIGKLNRYNEVFNLKVYEQYKDKYIADLVSKKNLNQINQELYLKLNLKGEIKFKHYFMSTISLFWNKVYNLKMLLKKAN